MGREGGRGGEAEKGRTEANTWGGTERLGQNMYESQREAEGLLFELRSGVYYK